MRVGFRFDSPALRPVDGRADLCRERPDGYMVGALPKSLVENYEMNARRGGTRCRFLATRPRAMPESGDEPCEWRARCRARRRGKPRKCANPRETTVSQPGRKNRSATRGGTSQRSSGENTTGEAGHTIRSSKSRYTRAGRIWSDPFRLRAAPVTEGTKDSQPPRRRQEIEGGRRTRQLIRSTRAPDQTIVRPADRVLTGAAGGLWEKSWTCLRVFGERSLDIAGELSERPSA